MCCKRDNYDKLGSNILKCVKEIRNFSILFYNWYCVKLVIIKYV